MTGDDVKQIREALGAVVGRRLSQRDLGIAMGLAPANADRLVRQWEEGEPSGPAAVALRFMREATPLGIETDNLAFQERVATIVVGLFSEA